MPQRFVSHSLLFLSTPSARRATGPRPGELAGREAISIHALREEGDHEPVPPEALAQISIHALREEGDQGRGRAGLPQDISIHALREEGDAVPCMVFFVPLIFLSTPSARRATLADSVPWRGWYHFYPRPPRGGRHRTAAHLRGRC